MKKLAIIPARGGSKRIQKKNIKSKKLHGPTTYHLKRKKFKTALKLVI